MRDQVEKIIKKCICIKFAIAVLVVVLVITLDVKKAIVIPSEEGFIIVVVGDFFQI